MLIKYVELVPYPGRFIHNVQAWQKDIFMSALGQPSVFFSKFLILPCFCPLQIAPYLLASATC